MKFLLLNLILAIFVIFFAEGTITRCFTCYEGRDSRNINQNFSLLLNCEYFSNRENYTIDRYFPCKDGCMKLYLGVGLGSSMKMSIYTCQDRDIDVKMKGKAVIQLHVVCYSNFCNGESDWKIPNLKKTSDSKDSDDISPVFWICLSIAIIAVMCFKINGICVEPQSFPMNNITIPDSSGEE